VITFYDIIKNYVIVKHMISYFWLVRRQQCTMILSVR